MGMDGTAGGHPDRRQGLTIRDLVASAAGAAPDAIAITGPGREGLTYGRLAAHIDDTVAKLRRFGIGRNDRVAIVLPNGPEMATAFLAVASGATAAPLNPGYRTDEFDFYLSDLDAKALIVTAGAQSPSREVARARGIPIIELQSVAGGVAGLFTLAGEGRSAGADFARAGDFAAAGDVAIVLHTSGTTSRPKMVPLTQANMCVSARNVAAALELAAADRCLNVMPLFHIHGIVAALLASLSAGGSVACTGGFNAPEFFAWMDECRPTWYTAVPTMQQAILARAEANSAIIKRRRLRFVRSSSSAMPPQVMAELERVFGAPLIEAYGMTEAAHQMASNPLPPRARKAGSVGVAAGPEIAIMDDGGNLVAQGATGEIVIRGANVTQGYAKNAAANEKAFTNGWFRTGDQGYLDGEGYLFITGRIKEIINRGGEKISPREIDEVLLDHPAVAQAVTFAVPDARLGEDVGAAIVLREGARATGMDIREHAAKRLADFKVPSHVVFLREIPKGPTGKLQRIGLAEKLGITGRKEPGKARTEYVAPRTPFEGRLARIWEQELRLDRVGARDDFFDIGGDSILAARVFNEIHKTFGRRLPLTVLLEAATIEKLAALLAAGETKVSPIVALVKGEGRRPFFCIANSDAFAFANLARLLGAEQPFYGLHPLGIVPYEAPEVEIEALAAEYLKYIRAVQPKGPYMLGGKCSSGFVAYEAAQQLRAQGEEVSLLVLIDAPGPWTALDTIASARRAAGRFARHMLGHVKNVWRLPGGRRGAYIADGLKRLKGRVAAAGGAGRAASDKPLERIFWRALKNSRARYRPRRFDGRIVMFLTPEEKRRAGSGKGLRWKAYAAGGAEVYGVDAIHAEMLREPHVRVIAEKLKMHIERAGSGGRL